jgi:hypothetical protein
MGTTLVHARILVHFPPKIALHLLLEPNPINEYKSKILLSLENWRVFNALYDL